MSDIQSEAARPKRSRDADEDDAPVQESMRGLSPRVIKRNPSEDQKKARRQIQRKVATSQELQVATNDGRLLINPGDNIRTPTGQTMRVRQIRRHETSPGHFYLDTDSGNTVVKGTDRFQVVPVNMQQQEAPGFGTPGGNTNKLPMDPHGPGGSNTSQTNKCPTCGSVGTLHRVGDHYQCSRCGHSQNVGAGGSGHDFSTAPHTFRQYSTVNRNLGAVASRARSVLEASEETQ